jgi:ATP adenylyltransferase
MKNLWAPWRVEFLESIPDECIFCENPKRGDDEKYLILIRGKYSFVMLNKYPYNSGHLMVSPYRHVLKLEELNQGESLEMLRLLQTCSTLLEKAYEPAGFNLGANIGSTAGAGFEHLHIHIVPRWNGDSNFMPVLAETKVLPEHLDYTYRKLKRAMKKDKQSR